MKKHAFLIQIHKQPELVIRILKILEDDLHYFFINIDKKTSLEDKKRLKDFLKNINNVMWISEFNVMHGGFSQVQTTLNQIERARNCGIHFDYFHTLSGQDYPLMNSKSFNCFFENTNRSFMFCDTEEEVIEWRGKKYSHRLKHWNFTDLFNKNNYSIFFNKFLRGALYLIPRYYNMDNVWGSWNWFSLTYEVIEYFMTYCKENPKYLKRFHHTTGCDEIVFASILYPQAKMLNIEVRNALRYIVWHPKRPYTSLPLILNENEYEDIKKSNCIFCRKVDLVESSKLLDLIDENMIREHM